MFPLSTRDLFAVVVWHNLKGITFSTKRTNMKNVAFAKIFRWSFRGSPDLDHTATKIPFMYSFSGNCASPVLISTFKCLWAIDLRILLQEICGPILGIYKSLTDTWMWKLGLSLRNCFSGNICYEFSALVLCSALWLEYSNVKKEIHY